MTRLLYIVVWLVLACVEVGDVTDRKFGHCDTDVIYDWSTSL